MNTVVLHLLIERRIWNVERIDLLLFLSLNALKVFNGFKGISNLCKIWGLSIVRFPFPKTKEDKENPPKLPCCKK